MTFRQRAMGRIIPRCVQLTIRPLSVAFHMGIHGAGMMLNGGKTSLNRGHELQLLRRYNGEHRVLFEPIHEGHSRVFPELGRNLHHQMSLMNNPGYRSLSDSIRKPGR